MGYLKVYNLDLTNPGDHFQLLQEFQMEEKFKCISWGASYREGEFNGLIAGGMQDGSLMLWEGRSFLEQEQHPTEGLVANMDLYEPGQFNCLEWGPFKKEMLATGGTSLYIVNVEKSVDEPAVFCPNNKKDQDLITSVSWNKNKTVPHILATATTTGIVNVWDLKVKKSISSFRDKSQESNRDVKISWNPNIPTQMAVVFDDLREPGIQIWDLRNPKAPVTVFKDNHKNAKVHALDWSTSQKTLALSADRNNLVCCQDIKSNETLLLEQESREIVSVKFADALESIFIIEDLDSTLSFHTVDKTMLKKLSTTHAPKWMKNPAAVTSTMNSSVSFREATGDLSSTKLEVNTSSNVNSELQKLADLVDCQGIDELTDHYSREHPDLWKMIQASDLTDVEMLQALGFDVDDITTKTENLTGKSHKKKTNTDRRNSSTNKMTFEFTDMNPDQAEDFFNMLSNVDEPQEHNQEKGPYYSNDVHEQETVTVRNENWDAGLEDMIRRNIVIGNFHGAIDCAIKAGRYAHAFLIAYSKKDCPELLLAAAEGISLMNNDRISSILQSMIEEKTDDIVEAHDLERWKELSALIISNYPKQKSSLLCQLSSKLQKAGFVNEAIAVCLISKDFDTLFQLISASITGQEGAGFYLALVKNFTILLAIKRATGEVSYIEDIQTSLCKLIHLMIEAEEFKLAMHFLEELGDQQKEEISFLMNCIFYSNESSLSMCFNPPTYRFAVKVKQPPKQETTKQASQQQGRSGAKPGSSSNRPAFEPKKKQIIKPPGPTWTEKGQDDDNASQLSDMDPKKHFAGRPGPKPPTVTNPMMSKRAEPSQIKTGPPPPPVKPPTTAGPVKVAPPPPKHAFNNKSTEEVVDHHITSTKAPTGPPQPKKPVPPPVRPAPVEAVSEQSVHSKQGPPPPANINRPALPGPPRPGPPPPAPAGPPAPSRPVPPKQTGPPPAPKPPATQTQPANPTPSATTKPPGPPPPARPVPTPHQPPTQANPPVPTQPVPPAKLAPPPPAHKTPTPPTGRPNPGPPKAGPPNRGPAPPPKATQAKQQAPGDEDEAETLEESVMSGLDQCKEFLEDIVGSM